MNVTDAAYNTGHDYPGGLPSLAPRMGMSPNTLQNKLNPSQSFHKLTLDEAMKLQVITCDHRILHAMACELGYVCIDGGNFENVSDQALLDLFTEQYAALGEFSGNFRKAFEDGVIDQREREQLSENVYRIKQILSETLSRIDSIYEQGRK